MFVSSLIAGMEPIRAAARAAVNVLGHVALMAEDFGALPHSPQVSCLDGVRRSAVVVLILGDRYGAKQTSGLSATHEEYREARTRCQVLAFVQEGVDPEPAQVDFIREVQGWAGGLIRVGFTDPADLQAKITGSLHRLELSAATAPFDANEVLTRAIGGFGEDRRGSYGLSGGVLSVSIAGGPAQTVLRPSAMENPALAESLEQQALFGRARIFERGQGTETTIRDGKLVLRQEGRASRSMTVDAYGGVVTRQPVENNGNERHGFSVILEEVLIERLEATLSYSAWLLEQLDPVERLSHVVIAASVTGGLAMMTGKELAASGGSIQMSGFGDEERRPVHLTPAHMPRAALVHLRDQLVADLVALLRRQWRRRA